MSFLGSWVPASFRLRAVSDFATARAPGKAWICRKGERHDVANLESRLWNPVGVIPTRPKPSQQAGSESCVAFG